MSLLNLDSPGESCLSSCGQTLSGIPGLTALQTKTTPSGLRQERLLTLCFARTCDERAPMPPLRNLATAVFRLIALHPHSSSPPFCGDMHP